MVVTWLAITLGVALGSAICPLISVEVFLVGLVATNGHHPLMSCWMLGAVIAIGQVVGKLLYFYAARGDVPLPNFLRPKQRTGPEPVTRWRKFTRRCGQLFTQLRDKCERHPGWLIGTTGISALTGMPPFAATTILAGVARMSVLAFLLTTLTGRFVRFTAIAASPDLLAGMLPHLS
ncbi:hypothetical protein GCM10010174_63660 [Kutzneria viridogrisea]